MDASLAVTAWEVTTWTIDNLLSLTGIYSLPPPVDPIWPLRNVNCSKLPRRIDLEALGAALIGILLFFKFFFHFVSSF